MNPVGNPSRGDSKPRGASKPARMIPGSDPAAGQWADIHKGVNRWERIDGVIAKGEQILIATFLAFMILLAMSQIVLRNFFDTGLDWGDSVLRNLVLWIGFIGATLATREEKHINIDLVSKWLPSLGRNIVTLLTHLFSIFVCLLLTYAALKFIRNESQMGNRTFFDIQAWIPEMILPMTFGLMSFRFGLRSFRNLSEMGKTNSLQDQEGER